jgi:hypothetical protein
MLHMGGANRNSSQCEPLCAGGSRFRTQLSNEVTLAPIGETNLLASTFALQRLVCC